mgnify:CR=1 FL=1
MSAQLKDSLRTTLAKSIVEDIHTQKSRFGYFLGKTIGWESNETPQNPSNSYAYEVDARNNIITTKRISSSDVALVVPRTDWTSATVYDQYDDYYQDLKQYATGFISSSITNPVVIGLDTKFLTEVKVGDRLLTIANNTSDFIGTVKSITSDTRIVLEDNAAIALSEESYQLHRIFAAPSGATAIEDAKMYVMNSEFNVYKCLDNNNNAVSVVEPMGFNPPQASDGYIWKYLYTIPVGIRNKFLTNAYMPVTVSLQESFYSSGQILKNNIIITNGGSGYDDNTQIIVYPQGLGAEVVPVIDGGQIVDIIVNNSGDGYPFAIFEIVGAGSGAEITCSFPIGDVSTQQSDVELSAIEGAIHCIKVMAGGSNFVSPTVTIRGDGTGATATAVVNNGAIEKIVMTSVGSGYSYANVVFSDTTGRWAYARAIMSPIGGHGKNSVNELHAKTVMMYSSISTEKNQGFTLANDYRQIGIVKNMRTFGDSALYNGTLGSACYKILLSPFIAADIYLDAKLCIKTDSLNSEFAVVAIDGDYALLQPLTKKEISVGNYLYNKDTGDKVNGNFYQVLEIVSPTVDKFSGELLFIDNRASFTPSNEQSVVIRSIITL